MKTKKPNYLNNKDLLAEIHKSKLTYCKFFEENCEDYDIIVDVPRAESRGKKVEILDPRSEEYVEYVELRRSECLDPTLIAEAKVNKANKLSKLRYLEAVADVEIVKPLRKNYIVSPDDIKSEDLVIRFHTFEQVPLLPIENLKKKPVTETDYREKICFVPFLHYKLVLDEQENAVGLREVGRSHVNDQLEFDNDIGQITPKLAKMFVLLAEKYGQKHNWRGYTYVDDMKGNALLQLSSTGLQFNEARSDNPFAYLTTTLRNAFLRVLQAEKKEQDIRDDLIEKSGKTPSSTRQLEHEETVRLERERFNGEE